MYKLTLILFAFLSLVFPILAVPIPVPNEIDGLAQCDTTARTGTSFTGTGTIFDPGLGACGTTSTSNLNVVAISTNTFGIGAQCGKFVGITFGGKSVDAMVVDKCDKCGDQDIGACQNTGSGVPSTHWVFLSEMSPAAFQGLAALTVGAIQVTWDFL